jgi:hypothetical protein
MESIEFFGAAAVLVFFTVYFGFKFKQAAGLYRRNGINVKYGGGSFIVGIKSGVMTWVWGALCVAAGFGAFVAIGGVVNHNSSNKSSIEVKSSQYSATTDSMKISMTPEKPKEKSQNNSVPGAPAFAASGAPEINTGVKIPDSNSTTSVSVEIHSKTLDLSSAIQICEAESNFISKNNCRWEQCAIAENVDNVECKNYQKKE